MRTRAGGRAVVAGAALVALGAAPAAAGELPAARFGVGDSIMRSASDELAPYRWDVNAEVGRQFSAGAALVIRKAERGNLPSRVVVHLGTNGAIDPDDCDALVAAAAPHRRLFLATIKVPRGWQDSNNDILQACAASSRRVYVVRWYAHSNDHPEWFADDGYHLNADGQAEYAGFLESRVRDVLAALRAERDG